MSKNSASADSGTRFPTQPLPLVLSDGQFVHGPNVKGFDTAEFLKQNPKLSEEHIQDITCVALRYSINPKVLLTFTEMQSRLVSDPSSEAVTAPIKYETVSGFTSQVNLLTEHLFQAFYWHLYGYQPYKLELGAQPELYFEFEDGSKGQTSEGMNAATYAIQSVLAELSTTDRWYRLVSQDSLDGFYQTYMRLFPDDDPLDSSNVLHPNAIPPSNLLKLPFACGDTWQFTGGPHGGETVWPAVDFAPGSGSCGSPPSNRWVVAAANGVVFETCGTCSIGIDHGVDGWQTFYYHLTNPQVSNGTPVAKNEPIGNPSCSICCGGSATGVHVHFDIRQNGLLQPIAGTSLEGWVVHAGSLPYEGYLQKGSTIKYRYDWVLSEDCGCCCKPGGFSACQASEDPDPEEVISSLPLSEFQPSVTVTLITSPTLTPIPTSTPPPTPTPTPTAAEVRVAQASGEAIRTPPASASYCIARSVFGSGGGPKTSTHYVTQGTSGQTTGVAWRQSSGYMLRSGYWGRIAVHSAPYVIYLPIVIKQQP